MKKTLLSTLLLAALSASPASADWCDGTRYYLMEMPLSQRIAEANGAVALELARAEESLQVLAYDLETQRKEMSTHLEREQAALLQQARTQCTRRDGSAGAEQSALRAQARLDLAALAAMQDVASGLEQMAQKHQQLREKLQAKQAELRLLQQRLARLAAAPEPIEARLALRSACTAVDESSTLRSGYHPLSLDRLYSEAVEEGRHTKDIPESAVAAFMEECSAGNVTLPPKRLAMEESWWKFW